MELQENLEHFAKHKILVYAISYDSVDVLTRFAGKFNITYPLLSDVRSEVIRQFGILNTNVPQDHPWYGVPFPGTFMVDERGRVIEKSFYADHAVRDSVVRMLHDGLGAVKSEHAVVRKMETGSLKVTASLSSRTIRPGQALTFTLEIDIQKGHHIYGQPIPEGYIPTKLAFDDIEGVHFGTVIYPVPHPYRVKGLNEAFHVYSGQVVFKASVISKRKESFSVRAHLEYQACDENECYLPQKIAFEFPLECLPNIRD